MAAPPRRVHEDVLLQQWPLSWGYNFLHLPKDEGKGEHLGIAVINFVSTEHAEAFKALWHHGHFAQFGKAAPMSVGLAGAQGFEANVKEARRQSAGGLRCQPFICLGGRQRELHEV